MKNQKFQNGTQKLTIKKRLGIKSNNINNNHNNNNGGVVDARQKIIQKKRNNVVDARDILAKMAKTQDARNKINKLRQTRSSDSNMINHNMRTIGSSILRKTDRNGKISLVTNKPKQQNTSDMNIAIQQQLGLIPSPRPKKIVSKSSINVNKHVPRNINPPIIRKTILNDLEYTPNVSHVPYNYEQADLYKWYRHDLQPPRILPPAEPRRPLTRSIVNSSGDWYSYPTNPNRYLYEI